MEDEWREGGSACNSAEDFAHVVGGISVAHLLGHNGGAGFDAVQTSASHALVEVLGGYIRRIGTQAKDLAEVAGRTKPLATDVLLALEDMVPYPVDMKDIVKTLHQYQGKLAFPREVPRFPIQKKRKIKDHNNTQEEAMNLIGRQEKDHPVYAPSFAPPLPHKHTYSQESKIVVEKEQDLKRIRLDLLRQKSEVLTAYYIST